MSDCIYSVNFHGYRTLAETLNGSDIQMLPVIGAAVRLIELGAQASEDEEAPPTRLIRYPFNQESGCNLPG